LKQIKKYGERVRRIGWERKIFLFIFIFLATSICVLGFEFCDWTYSVDNDNYFRLSKYHTLDES